MGRSSFNHRIEEEDDEIDAGNDRGGSYQSKKYDNVFVD